MNANSWIVRTLQTLALPVILVGVYLLGTLIWPSPFFPPVEKIMNSFAETWLGRGFELNVLPSLSNLSIGYILGLIVGVALGGLLGRVLPLNQMFSPVLGFLLTIPPIAILPVFLFIFGIGPQFQIAAIVYGTMTYMLLATAAAVRAIESTLEDVGQVFRIDPLRRVFLMIYPAALPRIIAAARVSLASALLIMVVSEMIGTARGIGAITLTAQQGFNYPQMWSGMILVAILGVAFSYVFVLIEKLVGSAMGARISMEGA